MIDRVSTVLPTPSRKKHKKVKSSSWARKCKRILARNFRITTKTSISMSIRENLNLTQWMKQVEQNQTQEVEDVVAINCRTHCRKTSRKITTTKDATLKRTVRGRTTTTTLDPSRKEGREDITEPTVITVASLLSRNFKWFSLILINAMLTLQKSGKFSTATSWSSQLKKLVLSFCKTICKNLRVEFSLARSSNKLTINSLS